MYNFLTRTLNLALLLSFFFSSFARSESPLEGLLLEEVTPVNERFQQGKFIVPNEKSYFFFEPALKNKKGVYLGVGTFRALEAIASGDFEYGILIEIDAMTAEFNRRQIEILEKSSSGASYLAGLIGQPDQEALIASALAGDRSALSEVEGRIKNSPVFKTSIAPENYETAALQYGLALFALVRNHPAQSCFLTDARKFGKLRVLAAHHRLVSMRASWTAYPGLLADLAARLSAASLPVSVIDLSNVLEYVIGYESDVRGLVANLRSFSLSEDAVVLQTRREHFEVPSAVPRDDYWRYIVTPATPLVDIIEYPGAKLRGLYDQDLRQILNQVYSEKNCFHVLGSIGARATSGSSFRR